MSFLRDRNLLWLIWIFFFVILCYQLLFALPVKAQTEEDIENIRPTTLWDKIKSTGLIGFALFVVSIIGMTYGMERFFNLRQYKIVPNGLKEKAQKLWHEKNYAELLKSPGGHNSTFGRIIYILTKNKHCNTSDLSMLAGDISSRELKIQLQRAYPLAIVATISPLLGLTGTVIGMIGAFDAVAYSSSMGDPSIMAESISYALVTTAMGLVIAVPSLAAYHYFRIRTNSFALLLEERVNELINDWFMNGKNYNAN